MSLEPKLVVLSSQESSSRCEHLAAARWSWLWLRIRGQRKERQMYFDKAAAASATILSQNKPLSWAAPGTGYFCTKLLLWVEEGGG